MTKGETGFEVIETKLAELYELQLERIKKKMAMNVAVSTNEEVAEAREILGEWLWCIEAKDRVLSSETLLRRRRRVEAKAKRGRG